MELLLTDTGAPHPPPPAEKDNNPNSAPALDHPYRRVCLHYGDATAGKALPDELTHIYAFDRVFSPTTMKALASLLCRSPFRVFCSFRKYDEWFDHGLTCLHPVARLSVKTTGGEGMSVFVYANLRYAPRG